MQYDNVKTTYWTCYQNGWIMADNKGKFEADRKRRGAQRAEKRVAYLKDHKVIKTDVVKFPAESQINS